MDVPTPRTRRTSGLVLVAALALAACGGAPGSGSPQAGSEPGAAATGAESASPLPVIDVTDVKTGEPVALASLLPADKPVLVWMWAPH